MTTTDHPPHRARPIHAPVTALSHAAGSDHRPLLVNAVVHFDLAPGQLSAGRHRCVLSDKGLDERMQALSTNGQRRRSRRDKTQSPPFLHL